MKIPKLQRSNRSREYDGCDQDTRDKIIFSYLFEGTSHRQLDDKYVKIDSDYSRGWQSMGVLHYLGVRNDFKGIFSKANIDDAIYELESLNDTEYNQIIDSLKRYYLANTDDLDAIKNYANWMISANSNIYRHADSFAARGYIDWRQKFNFNVGDIVYIYCTSPDMKVMFKTSVEKINMPFINITDDKDYWINIEEYKKAKSGKYCRLKLLEQVDNPKLSLSNLLKNGLNAAPQGATHLKDSLVEYIDKHFNDFYSENYFTDISDSDDITEGLKKTVTVNKYERSSIARKKCIEHKGCYCYVCGIDFEKNYGELGKGFIHVHHIVPISQIDKSYKVDYKEDLVPICPNCHAMIHRKSDGKNVTLESLKRLYTYYKKLNS